MHEIIERNLHRFLWKFEKACWPLLKFFVCLRYQKYNDFKMKLMRIYEPGNSSEERNGNKVT